MKTTTKTAIVAALSTAFALGAAQAYAAESENVLVVDNGQERVWVFDKAGVTNAAAFETAPAQRSVIRNIEDLPELVVPLNTTTEIRAIDAASLRRAPRYSGTDLRDFDLVEDSPVFIGSSGGSEFDTRDAQRARAGFPDNIDIEPMVPVAGAGINSRF